MSNATMHLLPDVPVTDRRSPTTRCHDAGGLRADGARPLAGIVA